MQVQALSRRTFLKFAGVSVAGMALAACAPVGTAPAGGDADAAPSGGKDITLQYYIGFGAGGNPEQVSAVQELFDKFVAESESVQAVEPLVVPWAEAPRKFQTMVAGGTPPDVITMGMSQWDFAVKGAFIDIRPLAEADGVDLSEWDENALAAYTVAPRENMLYGLPFGLNDGCMVYNKTLFEEAGVEPPPHDWNDESWTWDVFVEKVNALTGGEGSEKVWGTTGIGGNWSVPWCFGGAWVDESLENIIVDSPESMQGIQLNYDLMQTHKSMPTAVDIQAMGEGNAFLTGRVGIYFDGAWAAGTLMQITDFEWDLAPVPCAPGVDITYRASPYYPDSLVISSKNAPQESWELVKTLVLDDENYKSFLRIMTMIPARKALRGWFADEFWKQEKPDINWDAFLNGFDYAQVQRMFFNVNWSEVNNTQDAALGPLWLGETTPDELIPELAAQLQEIWTRGVEQVKA
jgi:multiple sugar transport system substrate-binding protein